MSQRSITSFFARAASGAAKLPPRKSPPKSPVLKQSPPKPSAAKRAHVSSPSPPLGEDSPVKRSKRIRKALLSSSEDEKEKPVAESSSPKENSAPNVDSRTKKKVRVNLSLGKTNKEDECGEEEEEATKVDVSESPEKLPKHVSRKKKQQPVGGKERKQEKTENADREEEKVKEEEEKVKEEDVKAAGSKDNTILDTKQNDDADYCTKLKQRVYNPVEDAPWSRGEKVPYAALASTFRAIEETSGRLKTVEILANLFRSVITLTQDDLLPTVYLCLNRLAPAFEGIELGVGEMLLMRAVANTTGRSAAQVKADAAKMGDLGAVAEASRGCQRTMFRPAPLTVQGVFAKLKDIAQMQGHAAMNQKAGKIQGMLVACRDNEAKYLIRSLAGKLRIGLAEQSVLQALAHACVMTPPAQEFPPPILNAFKDVSSDTFKEALEKEALALKTAYCECPNYDLVIPALLRDGISRLSETCKLTPGIPLKPMLAHPTKGVQEVLKRFENCSFTCEWKYDGERAQVHLTVDGKVNVYSRNQENNTSKYPDIVARFAGCKSPSVETCVVDSEAVAWDRQKGQILPFQVLSTRKRKDAAESEIRVQVALFAFDLLYLNGESLVKKPFKERRKLLKEHFNEVPGEFLFAKCADPSTLEQVQEVLEESIRDKCEGLMVKTLEVDATYEIAKRSHNWLKLKKDYLDGVGDTLDLVVIGGYLGKGKRVGSYGGFLLACYDQNNEEYQTICKIGTGFSDEDLQKHFEFFNRHQLPAPKSYYAYDSSLAPDHWFDAVQVWEVRAADLSISPVHRAAVGIVDQDRGVSLRFPRFLRVREDKTPEDATSAQQVADLYISQETIKNQDSNKKTSKDDDFDL